MKEKLNLKIGDICLTYGGWECIVIWKTRSSYYYIIHKPNTDEESVPVLYDEYGKAQHAFSAFYLPIYDQHHPADIAIWAKEEIEEVKKKATEIKEKLNW